MTVSLSSLHTTRTSFPECVNFSFFRSAGTPFRRGLWCSDMRSMLKGLISFATNVESKYEKKAPSARAVMKSSHPDNRFLFSPFTSARKDFSFMRASFQGHDLVIKDYPLAGLFAGLPNRARLLDAKAPKSTAEEKSAPDTAEMKTPPRSALCGRYSIVRVRPFP